MANGHRNFNSNGISRIRKTTAKVAPTGAAAPRQSVDLALLDETAHWNVMGADNLRSTTCNSTVIFERFATPATKVAETHLQRWACARMDP